MSAQQTAEDLWHAVLSGTHPGWRRGRRLHALIPSSPRCKMCLAPFGAPGRLLMRLRGRGRSGFTPYLCDFCERFAEAHPGGAEIELTMLFADVRGSTGLAERMRPADFSRLMNRFYAVANAELLRSGAAIDKLVGDEVIALYVPGLVGVHHAPAAVRAAQDLLRATGHDRPEGPWLPVGIGLHTGTVYMGSVGAEGVTDITVLGDAVNTTARLAAQAGPGEILLSEAACRAASAGQPAPAGLGELECRRLELRGRSEPVDVRVLRVGPG